MKRWQHPAIWIAFILIMLGLLHARTARDSEPFFQNDEIRHTFTGVFFADALGDFPTAMANPKTYAVRYYCQYPALGLITWPPFFHIVEGLAMSLLGPHFWVGRLVVAGFALLALIYTYRFARLHVAAPFAIHAMLFVGLSPLVFQYSQRVMLEVPTLALALVSLVHFEKYLLAKKPRDAILACLFFAFAALTRYDGLFLVPYFALRILGTRNFRILLRRPVWLGLLLAAILIAPYYLLVFNLYRNGLTTSSDPNASDIGLLERLGYYLQTLPEQFGWLNSIIGISGVLYMLACPGRTRFGSAFALIASVFLFFTFQTELEPRHAIYWLPAFALGVAVSMARVLESAGKWPMYAALAALAGFATFACRDIPKRYLFGYSDAASWMMEHRATDRPVLVDGELTASAVYHVRKADPARTTWVLRADKLLYSMFSDPRSQAKQFVTNEIDVLKWLEEFDPEFIWIEDPQTDFHKIPTSDLLSAALKNHPESFELVHAQPLRTNYDKFSDPGTMLKIYRKLRRNPDAKRAVEIEIFGLGGSVGASRP